MKRRNCGKKEQTILWSINPEKKSNLFQYTILILLFISFFLLNFLLASISSLSPGHQHNLLLASLREGQVAGLEKDPAVTGELVGS
jgi:hypothetical protein